MNSRKSGYYTSLIWMILSIYALLWTAVTKRSSVSEAPYINLLAMVTFVCFIIQFEVVSKPWKVKKVWILLLIPISSGLLVAFYPIGVVGTMVVYGIHAILSLYAFVLFRKIIKSG